MLILSGYKDYYDYLTNPNFIGVDEKVVYNRVCEYYDKNKETWHKQNFVPFLPKHYPARTYSQDTAYETFAIHITGESYQTFFFDGKWYITLEQLIELRDLLKPLYYNNSWFHSSCSVLIKHIRVLELLNQKFEKLSYFDQLNVKHYNKGSNYNELYDAPVVLEYRGYQIYRNPKLSELGIPNILSPDEVYHKIYNWLSREKVIENNQTDKEKIVGHGFDLKESFRGKVPKTKKNSKK